MITQGTAIEPLADRLRQVSEHKRSEATFTHGLCPDCIKQYFPDLPADRPGGSPTEAP